MCVSHVSPGRHQVSARDAAIQAAARGWYVFPVRPGGKEPRRGLSWPAAATCDPAAVAAARWQPGENYGIAAKRSGLVILDLDMPKDGYQLPPQWDSEPGITDGKDVLAALADRNGVTEWPCTCTVRTPSGGMAPVLHRPREAGRSATGRWARWWTYAAAAPATAVTCSDPARS